ncbi:MAG: hypothetical protein M1838_005117 [Thelocarpon superellum]|nr:MAG: hypothetical protein M1838_005117 [Thelocarpon superellum]
MSGPSPLFTLPLPMTDGSLTCTEPVPKVYLLTLISPPDNRTTKAVCEALVLALDIIENRYVPGVVVTTSGIPKFYSNGMDLQHAAATPRFWEECAWPMFRRFLTYSMPTIAWLNGHTYAAGFMLAMHHDYRVFNPHRGWMCLNEQDFGFPLPPPMVTLLTLKVPTPATRRALVIETKRYTAPEALAEGLVDVLGGWPEVMALVTDKNLRARGPTGANGAMKRELYRDAVASLDNHHESQQARNRVEETKEREESAQRVESWDAQRRKTKL